MEAPAPEQQTFLHRVLRWLAMLAIGYGALQCLTYVLYAIVYGLTFAGYGFPRPLRTGFTLVQIAGPVLLLAGGWGLLKWKSWGRALLITWALLAMTAGLVSSVAYLVEDARTWSATAATTQAVVSNRLSIWFTFAGWVEHCALPLTCLWTLMQPEVKRLWARGPGHGGFDVIPMASAVGDDAGRAPVEVGR